MKGWRQIGHANVEMAIENRNIFFRALDVIEDIKFILRNWTSQWHKHVWHEIRIDISMNGMKIRESDLLWGGGDDISCRHMKWLSLQHLSPFAFRRAALNQYDTVIYSGEDGVNIFTPGYLPPITCKWSCILCIRTCPVNRCNFIGISNPWIPVKYFRHSTWKNIGNSPYT
jgi:hypothetical protein